jgi:ECF transporter S component (folate family)
MTHNRFVESAGELKKLPVLTACAMLAALAILLERVTSINIGPYIKIGFSALPNQICDALFGPVTGTLFAGILDVVKYFIRPDGPFFFGFTFNAMLAAFIYGCFYYKKKITIWRVLVAKFIVALIVNVLLNTWFLDMLYGNGFLKVLPARILKNVIMWPIDSIIFFLLYTAIRETGIFRVFENGRFNKSKAAASQS